MGDAGASAEHTSTVREPWGATKSSRDPAPESVMESAGLRIDDHIAHLGRFHRPRIRAVVLQRAVRPRRMIVGCVIAKDP